jgi:hypothetical protein
MRARHLSQRIQRASARATQTPRPRLEVRREMQALQGSPCCPPVEWPQSHGPRSVIHQNSNKPPADPHSRARIARTSQPRMPLPSWGSIRFFWIRYLGACAALASHSIAHNIPNPVHTSTSRGPIQSRGFVVGLPWVFWRMIQVKVEAHSSACHHTQPLQNHNPQAAISDAATPTSPLRAARSSCCGVGGNWRTFATLNAQCGFDEAASLW